MRREPPREPRARLQPVVTEDDAPTFVPPIETREIFRQMIAEELRSGRLTTARRRRVVRYAAQMGLSATEAGRLVDDCRTQALQSSDATERDYALRLAPPEPARIPIAMKLSLILLLVGLLGLVVLLWK